MACKTTVNGKTYHGENSIVIQNNSVFIDGKFVEELDKTCGSRYICINNNCEPRHVVYPEAPTYPNTVLGNVISFVIVFGVMALAFVLILLVFSMCR